MKLCIGRLAAAAVVFLFGAGAAWADKDRFDLGEDVPVFTLKALNPDEAGASYISVDHYFGAEAKMPKKVLLLSFFATYCEPCKKELPFLSAMYDAYGEQGLQTLLVSIDKEADKVEEAKNLAAAANVKFPVLSDRFNIVAKRYFISKLPCVYLINGDGKVSLVNVGYNSNISKTILDEVRKAVGVSVSEPIPENIAMYMTHDGPSTVDVPGAADDTGETGESKEVAKASTAAAATPSEEEEKQAEASTDEAKKGKGKKGKKRRRAKRKRRGKRK